MNTRQRCYSRLPFQKDKLDRKLGEVTYPSGDFLITAQGKFMVAGPNKDGLCEVMFQYLDLTAKKWVRIYLRQKHVDKLIFPDKDGDPITCEDIRDCGLELGAKK